MLICSSIIKYHYFIIAHSKWIIFPSSCLLPIARLFQWPSGNSTPVNGSQLSSWQRGSTTAWTRLRPSELVPLWCSCYGNSIFCHSWWGCCAGKERQKERTKRGLYVSGHSPEHTTPRKWQLRTFKRNNSRITLAGIPEIEKFL